MPVLPVDIITINEIKKHNLREVAISAILDAGPN